MSQNTNIEWTDATWNPIRGCSRVSEGCRNCYAEKVAKRFSGHDQPYEGLIAKSGQWNGRIKVADHLIDEPLKWKKSRRIFVNSMSDLFHENVDEETILAIFTTMAKATQHTFQILTKRPQRMCNILQKWESSGLTLREGHGIRLTNVWLGVSVENQQAAEERIPALLQTPAAIRWVSAEPLLGPLDLTAICYERTATYEDILDALFCEDDPEDCHPIGTATIDWVVAGGESGAGARSLHPDWIRSLRDQCTNSRVPFFFKQWGEWLPGEAIPGRTVYARCDNGADFTHTGNKRRDNFGTHSDKHSGPLISLRIGKKNAGRMLDGKIWNQFPGDLDYIEIPHFLRRGND